MHFSLLFIGRRSEEKTNPGLSSHSKIELFAKSVIFSIKTSVLNHGSLSFALPLLNKGLITHRKNSCSSSSINGHFSYTMRRTTNSWNHFFKKPKNLFSSCIAAPSEPELSLSKPTDFSEFWHRPF